MDLPLNPDAALEREQLDLLHTALLERQDELTLAVEELNRQIVAKQDCSIADAAEAAYLREEAGRAQGIVTEHTRILREIDGALDRLKLGTYGVCESTGEPIPFERLRLIPWAREHIPDQ